MSDTRSDLTLPEQEAGALFRAEMWLTNFFLGYWKHLVAVIVVVLLGLLIVGQYNSTWRRNQRAMTAQVSEVWAELPEQIMPGEITDAQATDVKRVADELTTLGAGFKGSAAAEAHLKAAELYRIIGDSAAQRQAFESAVPHAQGALYFAARSGIANLEVSAGNTDAAAAIHRELSEELDGYLAQQATLDLAQTYALAGRDAEARSVYVEFQGRWPDSPRTDEVTDRLDRLGVVGPAGLPDEAPEDLPVDEPAPMDEAAPIDEGAPTDEAAPSDVAPTDAAPTDGSGEEPAPE